MSAPPPTTVASSAPPRSLPGSIGLVLGLLSLGYGLLLPLFWPPASKWPSYLNWRPLAFGGMLLSPYLIILGFGTAAKRGKDWLLKTLLALTASLGLLLLTVWLVVELMALPTFQLDRLMALHPYRFVPFLKKSFVFVPVLFTFCLSLLVQKKLRNHLGLALLTLAYHSLLLFGYLLLILQLIPKLPLLSPGTLTKVKFTLALSLSGASLVGFVAGTLLLESGRRLRTHLMYTTLLWLPLYGIFFFWSLVVDTTLFFVERRLPIRLQKTWQKVLVAPLCLLLFPIFLTMDFGLGLVRMFGLRAGRALLPDLEESSWLVYFLGTLLFFTMPFWGIPMLLFGAIRLFVYETLLLPLSGRPAFDPPSDSTDN